MKSLMMDLKTIKRSFNTVYPVDRIGFHFSHPEQNLQSFSGKLELCLRISSEEDYAEDLIDGIKYRTPFPHVILKRPLSTHTYSIHKSRNAVYLMYNPQLEKQMIDSKLLPNKCCWPVSIDNEINSILFRLRELTEKSSKLRIIDKLDLVAMDLFETLVSQANSQHTEMDLTEKIVHNAAIYMEFNITEPINVDKLAEEQGVSRRTFFRYWKQFYDISPAQYHKELQLQYACRMLNETSLSISEISDKLKLSNSQYLCKIFRQRFGTTPLNFRNRRIIKSP